MDLFFNKTVLTVSRLTSLLRGVLEDNFELIWVQGEVSNLSLPSSGHCYFSLKDAGAQIRCIFFKSGMKNLKFRLVDGMSLIIRGRISVYDQRGEYQIVCDYAEPDGVGALQTAFLQLKEKLSAEGLFEQEHKKAIPRFPARVGIITSPTGAAIQDILTVTRRRFASLSLLIYPVRVQGEGAAEEIALALEEMNLLGDADVLIVARGGGSMEDLWSFNEEVVARAIFRSVIPVISAVGHETDWTISDFVADLRAPTPSAAAELVIASSEELQGLLASLSQRLNRNMATIIDAQAARLKGLRRALHDPGRVVGHLAQRLDDLNRRAETGLLLSIGRQSSRFRQLESSLKSASPSVKIDRARQTVALLAMRTHAAIQRCMEYARQEFGGKAAQLEVLSPLKTLARGYAVATSETDGRVVADTAGLVKGEKLLLRFHRGKACCVVESSSSDNF